MKKIALLFIILLLFQSNKGQAQTKYQKDFTQFWNDIHQYYAYLEEQQIDWNTVKLLYEPQLEQVHSDAEFITFLESVINELYNGHSSLNTNLSTSNRIVPSGQDIFVEKINNQYIISDIRQGYAAEHAGLKIGMQVVAFNGEDITEQLIPFLPKFTAEPSPKMLEYAIAMLFAGKRDKNRVFKVIDQGAVREIEVDNRRMATSNSLLSSAIWNKNTAYIKINNSLGENELIAAFDLALDSVLRYKNLILDLTETANGGNTTVARGIMGRFIAKQSPYQVHEMSERAYGTVRHWVEYVSPRGKQYTGKLYILVGHWTGSMGEGICIGFDGLKRGKTIGTPMAGLLGAIYNFSLPETHISYQFPVERLYHINGTARAEFRPLIKTKNILETYKIAASIR